MPAKYTKWTNIWKNLTPLDSSQFEVFLGIFWDFFYFFWIQIWILNLGRFETDRYRNGFEPVWPVSAVSGPVPIAKKTLFATLKEHNKEKESNSRTLPLPRHTIIDVGTIHEKTFFKSSIEKTQCFESYIFKIDNEILKIAFSSYSSLSLSLVSLSTLHFTLGSLHISKCRASAPSSSRS